MTGLELVSGYLLAWATHRAQQAGNRFTDGVDRAVATRLEKLHHVVVTKLGGDPALHQLEREAVNDGSLTPRTQRRVNDSLEEAVEADPAFAAALTAILMELRPAAAHSWSLNQMDLRGAKGMQIGDGNTQNNKF